MFCKVQTGWEERRLSPEGTQALREWLVAWEHVVVVLEREDEVLLVRIWEREGEPKGKSESK